MFRIDRKALMSKPGMAMSGMAVALGCLMILLGECTRPDRYISRDQVWDVVRAEAGKHDLDPEFVFAIIAAESSFNARARNGDARGLMQLRPIAWREVSETSHRRAWRWKENIAVGTAYLGYLKDFLDEHEQFSYPMLAACYRYGPFRVKGVGFRLEELPPTRNEIYHELFRGNVSPVPNP